MKKCVYIILFLSLSVSVFAQYGFQKGEDFSSFICNYYSNPQPERIPSSFDYYVNLQHVHANSIMMASFYAVLLREHATLLETWFDEHAGNRSAKAKKIILRILAEINTPQSLEYLAEVQKKWQEQSVQDFLEKIKTSKFYDVLADIPRNTADLDRLWGIFWATGNRKAINQIISVLYLWEEGRGRAAATGGAAMWSLSKYAAQHPKILQIVKAERDNSSGTQKNLLEEIVSKVEKK